jgi:integrase
VAQDHWLFRRRGSTRWTFAWAPDPSKKEKRKQTLLPEEIKNEREAKRYAELHEEELKNARPRARTSKDITVAEMIDRWVKLRADDNRFAASTTRDAIGHLQRFVARPVGAVDLGSMSPGRLNIPTLRAWVRELSKAQTERGSRPLAPFTIRNILRALVWFLDDVQGEGWAFLPGGNPARAKAVRTELPEMAPLAGASQKLRVREASDAQKLMDCAHVPMERRVRYVVGLTAGLRDGEIAALLWRDVDLDAGVIRVRKALQLRTREGGARLGKTKTRSSVRVVPLHPAARDAVLDWQRVGWEIHVGHAPRPEDPVFANRDGNHHRPRSADLFRDDAGAAGLPTHVDGHPMTFHALRRSFASWLRAEGVPQEVRQVLMGHVPKTAEERHYSEEDPAALAAHVAKIALVWNKARAEG